MPSSLALHKTWSGLFNLLFPDSCRICETTLTSVARYPVCRKCLDGVAPLDADYFCASCRTPFLTPHPLDEQGRCGLCRRGMTGFDSASSYGFHEGSLRKLIHLYKYAGIHTLAKPLAGYLLAAMPRQERFDLIVPVPVHWRRKWSRGFNQSELLAREVSRRTAVPVACALRRAKTTPPQAGLSDHERRRNVTGAFHATRNLEGQHVLLVDDVMTTGATVSACGAVLKRSGAARVTVLTLARTDRRGFTSGPGALANSNFAGGW
ncbi:MAG: ComF family protein [Bryobacterales bacterium]|nr:ComF family protein [Bryobacterales bacterium]